MRTCLRAALLPLLAFALLFTSVGAAQAAPEDSGNPGKVRFVKRMDSGFDPFIATNANSAWINQKFWRMEVFDPHFVNVGAVSWYTKGWAYFNSHGFWPDDASRLQWGLKSPSGELAYINWGCEDGACDRRAGDITNPDFRKNYVDELKLLMTRGYIGAWIDDVNMNLDLTNRAGAPIQVYSPSLGRVMTSEDWRKAMATFMEEIRAAIPNKELLHNSPWGAGRDWTSGSNYANWFPEIDRQIKAADYINREGGFASDGGLRGGNAEWSIRAVHRYADKVHANGAGIIIDDFVPSAVGREYTLANYLLVSNGRDGVGEMSQTPQNWWSGWEADLGQASGPRYEWQGLIRRDFAGGMALVREPEASTTGAIPLPAPMKKLDGTTVSTVTLSASQGIVLKTATQVAAPTISSLNPTKGFFDAATPVTITGTNLSGASVTVNGSTVTPSANTATSVSLTVPAGSATGTIPIRVTTAGGSATVSFTREARPPTISSMTPTKGFFDVATPVTITGTYLTGALVTVNGSSVTPSSVSATSVALTVPAGTATGSVPIKITTAGGSVTTTFTREARPVNPAPAITGVSRSLDQANNRFIATITGTGFTGATRVDFGTVASPSITVNSSTQITAVVPAQTGPLTVSVRVTTPAGTSPVVVPGTWQYFGAPKITSVTPSRGVAGTQVEVRGTGLYFARATVGGRSVASVSYPDQFDFLAPSGLTGTQPVVLTTPEGTASTTFTYEPVPTIASLSVTKGYVDVATPLELKGTNLIGTTVKVNGTTVVPSKVTPTSMVLTVPKGTAAGNATIAVTGPGGTATTTFAYITRTSTAPTITGISATSWYWNIATQVTITGTNLSAATLQVNGTTVTPKSRTATAVTVLLPVGSTPGTVATITLSTTAGTATTLYNWAPYLATSVAPNGTFEAGIGSWTAGSGVTMTSATDQKRSGTRSLKYVTSGAGIPVESLATSGIAGRYQVGGWALVPAGVEWSLDLTDSTGSIYARASAVGTGAWQYVSVVGVTASTRPGVKFRTASGATAWLDDVAVQAAT